MGRKKTSYSDLTIMIGKRLKEERVRRKFSMQELADKLGYEHGNSVLYWERGAAIPSDVFTKLSDIFNVRIEYLMCKDDYREKYNKIMNAEETTAWFRFTQNNLVETLHKLEDCQIELNKLKSKMDLNRINEKGVTCYLDGILLTSSEMRSLNMIIEGIKVNRKKAE